MRYNFKDISNQRFGRLVAMWPCGRNGNQPQIHWLCACECGEYPVISGDSLRRGLARSCGCLRRDVCRLNSRTTHGHCSQGKRSAESNVWHNMIQRCYNPRSPEYKHYGAKGRVVCPRWKASFVVWYAENGDSPTPEHTFDRINNEESYLCGGRECCGRDKSNCRWATKAEQASRTKLTPVIVRDIRKRYAAGETCGAISRIYQVSDVCIWSAATEQSWANV